MNATDLLKAAKATNIPEGTSGLWSVKKIRIDRPSLAKNPRDNRLLEIPPGIYTKLMRVTEATMHLEGEVVMEDSDFELKTHLDFMLRAFGKVLITGLGLGCVIRGCLANPRVKYVVCVERDPDVLKLVSPHMPKGRLTIIVADAVRWANDSKSRFDCAWHDLWSDEDHGEPHLQLQHSHMMAALADRVQFQGAWNFPREHKRLWRETIPMVG